MLPHNIIQQEMKISTQRCYRTDLEEKCDGYAIMGMKYVVV